MKVIILAGGLGTRLREETEFRPKPMVHIGGKPILWHIMKLYAQHGVKDFVVCTGYRGEVIKDYFLNYASMNNDFTVHLGAEQEIRYHASHLESDWTVTVVETGEQTNTGGRIKMAQAYIDEACFMATYGDGVADIDITALLEFHRAHGKIGTVSAMRSPSRFGLMELGPDDQVATFREKPQGNDWVSGGFFIFERTFFDYLSENSVLEREPLGKLAEEHQLMAFRHEGFWQPMDTYREFELLNSLWSSGRAPWKIWD